MGAANQKTAPTVIDPGCPDVFCSGLLRIEKLSGGNFRFVKYARHCDGDDIEHHIVSREVWNIADLFIAMKMVHQIIGETPILAEGGELHLLM